MLLDIIPLNEFIENEKKRPAIERTGGSRIIAASRKASENTEIYSRARAIFYRARRQRGFRASAIF